MATVREALFGRRRRNAPDHLRDQVWTLATLLTLARGALSLAILLAAIAERSQALLLLGLTVSMSLDVLDGYIARKRRAETILGAQLDGVADRLTALLVLAGALYMSPGTEAVVVASLVWAQYGMVEQLLNGQFLRFGLWSPDHFYEASEPIWLLNWSGLGKAVSGVPVILVALGVWWPAGAVALAMIAAKVACYPSIARAARRLPELRHPESEDATVTDDEQAAEVQGLRVDRAEDEPDRLAA